MTLKLKYLKNPLNAFEFLFFILKKILKTLTDGVTTTVIQSL